MAEAVSMNGDPASNRRAKTQFTVAPVASMFLVEGAFSTWAFGTLQVTDAGDTITVNLPNLASASDEPSVNLSGTFSITR